MIDVQVQRDLTDWVIDIATAVGTVGAVAVALWATWTSQLDARSARIDAREARIDAAKARQEAARAEEERDHRRRRDELTEMARDRALRQAVFITMNSRLNNWIDPVTGGTGDGHSGITLQVSNNSMQPITDLVAQWYAPTVDDPSAVEAPRITVVRQRAEPEQAHELDFGVAYIWPVTQNIARPFTLDFTDIHQDRWRLLEDGTLRLLNLRDIDIDRGD